MIRRSQILLVALVASVVACSNEQEMKKGVVVTATEQYVGATVLLDSRKVGEMRYLSVGVVGTILKKVQGDSPAAHIVTLRIDANEVPISRGKHLVQVEKAGLAVAAGSFDYPFKGEQVQIFFVDGGKFERMPGSS